MLPIMATSVLSMSLMHEGSTRCRVTSTLGFASSNAAAAGVVALADDGSTQDTSRRMKWSWEREGPSAISPAPRRMDASQTALMMETKERNGNGNDALNLRVAILTVSAAASPTNSRITGSHGSLGTTSNSSLADNTKLH
jgi:hypothetical protein